MEATSEFGDDVRRKGLQRSGEEDGKNKDEEEEDGEAFNRNQSILGACLEDSSSCVVERS